MTSSAHLQDLLLRYLLHEMEADERENFDLRVIADPDFSDAMQAAQHDLVDAFAADKLPQAEAARVRRAIDLNASFARAAEMAVALRLASRRPLPEASQAARFRFPTWAIAACGLLLIAAGVVGGAKWRQRASLAKSVAPAPVAAPVAPQQAAPSQAVAVNSNIPAKPTHSNAPALFATLLLPEGTRGASSVPLHIGHGVESIRVEWPVAQSTDDARKLTLTVVQDASVVGSFPEARPRQTISGVPVARFAVPVEQIAAGKYTFRVTSADESAADAPLTETAVEVTK